jgi:DNA-binding transcriptional LysR family regulator
MHIELRLLRHALAVGRHGNFARAAEELHLTQPSLSRSVASLEQALGVSLFDRSHKGVTPTAFGRILMERAESVLDREADLRREIQLLAGLDTGTLEVAAGPYPGESTAAEAIARVTVAYPRLKIVLEVSSPEQVHQHVLEGKVDVGVASTFAIEQDARVTVEPMPPRRIYMAARPSHPLAGVPQLTMDRVLEYPLVTTLLYGTHAATASGGSAAQGRKGFRPPIMVDSVAVARAIARQSDAIVPATYRLLAPDLEAGHLVILDIHLRTFRSSHGIITLNDRSLSPAARLFVETLRVVEAEATRDEPAVASLAEPPPKRRRVAR